MYEHELVDVSIILPISSTAIFSVLVKMIWNMLDALFRQWRVTL